MLIEKNSLLNRLPQNLDPNHALVLDGIRTCTHIIEESIRQLLQVLYQSSFDEKKPDNYRAFINVWTIIDNSYRLYKLFLETKRLINFEVDPSAIQELSKTGNLRHTFQHLDERIGEVFIKEKYPLFGQLSWIARKDITDNEGYIYSMICGYYPYNEQVFQPVNPAGKQLLNKIDLITISSIGRTGKNSFSRIDLTIDAILGSIKKCLDNIDFLLSNNKNLFDKVPSNDLDLIYQIKFEKTFDQKIICTEGKLFKRESDYEL